MLRLFFADQGEVSDALAAVTALRDWAATRYAVGAELIRNQSGQVLFPERVHIGVLVARLYIDLYSTMISFADLAEKEIRTWPRTDGLGRTDRTQELIDELLETIGQEPDATS
jgi:hypothetical protein